MFNFPSALGVAELAGKSTTSLFWVETLGVGLGVEVGVGVGVGVCVTSIETEGIAVGFGVGVEVGTEVGVGDTRLLFPPVLGWFFSELDSFPKSVAPFSGLSLLLSESLEDWLIVSWSF